MRILVTGGAGFIGSNLVDRLLADGHYVVAVDNFDPYYSVEIKRLNILNASDNASFHFVEADILDKVALDNIFRLHAIDFVFHLAGKAGVRSSVADPESYFSVNVMGTLIILEAMRKYGVNKMMFASSSSIYGNNEKLPFAETDQVDAPISPYAASKKSAELLLYTFHSLYAMDIFCFRFFTVYGPRQRPDLAIHKFTKRILEDEVLEIYGDGSLKRDFTYVEDIVNVMVSNIDRIKGYEIFNLGNSSPISVMDLTKAIEAVTQKKANIRFVDPVAGDVNTTYADVSKARSKLGYEPKTKIRDGLRSFVDWFIMQNNNNVKS